MARTPFNVLTFLIDGEIDRNRDFASRALAALHAALDQARGGDVAHFERLAKHYRRYRQDVLALDPQAVIPDVSLDHAEPAALRPAA